MRVLVSTDTYVSSPTFTGADGEAAACSSTPTVVCTRDDGTVLTAPAVTDGTGTGVYLAKLEDSIHTSRLDWLTLVWSGTVADLGGVTLTQRVEVVGGRYATVPQIRAMSGMEQHKVTAARIEEVISEFEDLAERYIGRALVPRYHRDNLFGTGGATLLASAYPLRSVISASSVDTNGTVTPFTITNWLTDRAGVITTDGDVFYAPWLGREPNIVIRYTHGEDAPSSAMAEACRIWVRSRLLADRAGIARDVLSQVDVQTGLSARYSTPDWKAGRPTGILDVDNVLNAEGRAVAGIA